MNDKNIIVLVGNGFDIANGFKTKFSDFADYYIEKKIIPEFEDVIIKKNIESTFFRKSFVSNMTNKMIAIGYDKPEDAIWLHIKGENYNDLKTYIYKNYKYLKLILRNSLMGSLYSSTDKNWFDIEKTYFLKLIEIKNDTLKSQRKLDIDRLKRLNKEFYQIKVELIDYLKTIKTTINTEVLKFMMHHFKNPENVYFINFNYTNTLKLYTDKISFLGNLKINHIHGDLESEKIIFGYGNDQNKDYKEIKELEENEFLRHFKTFDYLNNSNYDKVNGEAINKFPYYDVYVLGHSFGLTDKTLLSEILNHKKCRTIRFFKRADLQDNPSLVQSTYRDLTYAASRILINEQELRRKVVNFEDISSFP